MASKMYKSTTKTDKQLQAETEADLRKIARETGAKRVAEIEREKAAKAKPVGHLAKGLDAQNSPHSVKAIADAKRKTAPAAKAAPKAAENKAAKQAARAAKAAPKADDARKIVIVDKKFAYGKEGTSRRASWDVCLKSKTVADYAKAGGALKYLPRWVAAGAIKLG